MIHVAQNYRVGDLIAIGGSDRRPSKLVVAIDGTNIGYIPIYWVTNGMPQVPESGAGQVVGNLADIMENRRSGPPIKVT